MSRSVSVPSHAEVVAYTNIDDFGEGRREEMQDRVIDLRAALHKEFPSVTKDDRWLGNEDRVVASNSHAYFGLSEYCGLVSVWIVPREANYGNRNDSLKLKWIASIDDKFHAIVRDVFGGELRRLGSASNGEAFFERV